MASNARSASGNPTNDALTSLVYKITILVVDDDSTSLAIVSAMLRKFHYEVTSVKTPMAALSVLQTNGRNIDLVVTDLHMPEMNGIELQRRITRQYKLPVVIMSSDDSESAMVESLAGGAVFFIVKPVNPDGLKNVWQYAVSAKKGKAVVIDLDGEEGDSSPSAGKLSIENVRSPPPVNDNRDRKDEGKRGTKRKSSSKGKGKDDDKYEENKKQSPKMCKRPKVVWTNDLHNLFMDALKHIGFEKAVPKKILEHMNVTTLTRENVASHLQKYRMFLKRVAEKGCFTSKAIIDRFLKSTFAAGHPLLLKTAQEYSRMHDMERLRALTSYPGFGSSLPLLNAARYGSLGAPSGGYGSGQSRLLSSQTNRPVLVNNQPSSSRLRGFGNGSNGGFSTGLINGANSSYPHQIQPRPEFYNARPGSSSSSPFRLRSPVIHSSGSTLGNGIFGNTTSSYPSLNPGYTGNTNSYPDRQLLGMGQTTLHNSGYGSMNGTNFNETATMGNHQSFLYMTSGGYSNQVSPAFTASNQQASISSVLASLGGNSIPNDYNSDHIVENAPNLDNLNNEQLGGGGDGLLSDLILESNKLSNKQKKQQHQQDHHHQQQQQQQQQQEEAGSDGGENPESSLRSMFPGIYPTLEELLNFDESDLSDDTGPFSEEDVGQVQSALEQLINPNNTAAGDANVSNETNPTELIQNTNQQQSEGGGQLAEPGLIGNVIEVNDASAPAEDDSSDNQDQVDEDFFLDSLFNYGYQFE